MIGETDHGKTSLINVWTTGMFSGSNSLKEIKKSKKFNRLTISSRFYKIQT
jgi:GTPase SAR1 family protein